MNHILIKVNRISGWLLLAFMVIYIVSGYAWTNRSLMPLNLARYLHTTLDVYMVPVFLVHVLISTKFAVRRWSGVHYEPVIDLMLLSIGIVAYVLVLLIR